MCGFSKKKYIHPISFLIAEEPDEAESDDEEDDEDEVRDFISILTSYVSKSASLAF